MASPHASRAAVALTLALLLGGLATVLVAHPVKAGTAVVFKDDFETGVLGPRWNTSDSNPASGLDYWGVSSYRCHAGTYSAWSAQIGNQSDTGLNNSDVHLYDNDMQADLSIELDVSGFTSLTLSFYYYNKAESGGGDWIQAWYEANGTQTVIFTSTGTARWDLASVAVPNDVERLIIRFNTDAANHGFEGAYVDDVVLTGTEDNPPSSSVSPLTPYTNAVPFFVPYTASDPANESGVQYVELWYRHSAVGSFKLYNRTANPLGRWYPWASHTIPFDIAFAQGDGLYELYTIAVDNASNAEAPPASADASVLIDTTDPVLSVTAPLNGAWSGSSAVTVTWQGSDALSGIDRYESAIDGGAFSAGGLLTSKEFTGLSDGPHEVTVRAYDLAGNSATATASFSVDTTAPSVSIASPGANDSFHVSSVTFEWTALDAGSGVDHYEVWLDGGAHTTTAGVNLTIDSIPDGTHSFHVAAFDRVGNRRETSVTFTVGTTTPPDWLWLLLLIVIIAFLLILLVWWKRRRDEQAKGGPPRQEEGKKPEESPPEPETREGAPPPPSE